MCDLCGHPCVSAQTLVRHSANELHYNQCPGTAHGNWASRGVETIVPAQVPAMYS